MIIHYTHGLQVGVNNCGTDETKTPLLQVAGDPVAQLTARRHLAARPPAVEDGRAPDPVPEIAAEGAELLLQGEKCPGVAHRGVDLQPVADDAGISQQRGAAACIEARHLDGIEAGEGLSIGRALAQDGGPRQPGLCALEREHLEQMAVIVYRPTPLLIVIAGVFLIARRHPTAADSLWVRRRQRAWKPRISQPRSRAGKSSQRGTDRTASGAAGARSARTDKGVHSCRNPSRTCRADCATATFSSSPWAAPSASGSSSARRRRSTMRAPAAPVDYVVGGIAIFFIMRALGELLTYRPVAGSFATYADEFCSPFAGFVTGWSYWFMWVLRRWRRSPQSASMCASGCPGCRNGCRRSPR